MATLTESEISILIATLRELRCMINSRRLHDLQDCINLMERAERDIKLLSSKREDEIKVGDRVQYRGGFGQDATTEATVTGIEVTQYPRQKDGTPVDVVGFDTIRNNSALFVLDTGVGDYPSRWAYAEQIDAVQDGDGWMKVSV